MIFPSLFEGFGIPILEAQASGLPVAASNVSSIPEVVGEGGLLFDPADPAAMASAIERIGLDEALRRKLARKGMENADRYTWEATAEATLGVLREAAREHLAPSAAAPV